MKSRPILLVACLILSVLIAHQAQAEDVQLFVNELKVFPVHQPKRVAVGDPAIADITVLSDEEIMLMAKEEGSTNLIIWDQAGQRSFNIIVAKKDLDVVAQRLRELLVASDVRGVRVKREKENIYLTGDVLDERQLTQVDDITDAFQGVVNLVRIQERQPLVEIDVNVLEVVFDDLKRLGVTWSSQQPFLTYTEPSGGGDFPKLWKVMDWSRGNVAANLNLLIQENKARTLANPKLVTVSGGEANFLVGGEVPFVTVETEGRTSIEWKNYGIDLSIKPSVTINNEIKTSIEAKVTELDEATGIQQSGYTLPALKSRTAKTELFLNPDDTIIIGGLIKNEDSHNTDRLPWLSTIPILGELFKSKEFRDKRTELVISLTTRIIRNKPSPEYAQSEVLKEEAILSAQRRLPAYGEESSPIVYYSQMIEDMVTLNVVYPEQARDNQQEGIVKVDVCLLPNGQLKESKIKESSGFSALDQAALAAVQEQAPYPSFPEQISDQELRLTIPVVFKNYTDNE